MACPFPWQNNWFESLVLPSKLFLFYLIPWSETWGPLQASPEILGQIIYKLPFIPDESYLRELFLNLLSSSIDRENQGNAHSSFVGVLEGMSKKDAEFLAVFRESSRKIRYETRLPGSPNLEFIKPDVTQEVEGFVFKRSNRAISNSISTTHVKEYFEALPKNTSVFRQLSKAHIFKLLFREFESWDFEDVDSSLLFYISIGFFDIDTTDFHTGKSVDELTVLFSLTTLGKKFVDACLPPLSSNDSKENEK